MISPAQNDNLCSERIRNLTIRRGVKNVRGSVKHGVQAGFCMTLAGVFMMLTVLTGCLDADDSLTRAPVSFLLTWQSDPTSTMTIDWHPKIGSSSYLEYREEGVNEWMEGQGQRITVPGCGRPP